MDWLILLVLSALILIPTVFLGGFAGCQLFFPLEPPVPAPSDLQARPIGVDPVTKLLVAESRIDLTWIDNSTNATHFTLSREKKIDGETITHENIPATAESLQTFTDDLGLERGQLYEYVAVAVVDGKDSQPSNKASATTLDWKTTFEQGPTDVVGQNLGGFAGSCVVQRIAAPLAFSGVAVRITFRGSDNGRVELTAVSISQADGAGDEWDSANDLTQLFFGGAAGALVLAGTSVHSDETVYLLDKQKDLIVAFDIGTLGAGKRRTLVPGATFYALANASEALLPDRSQGFGANPQNDTVFMVEKIESLSG